MGAFYFVTKSILLLRPFYPCSYLSSRRTTFLSSYSSRIVGNIKKWKVKNEAIVLKKTNDGILRSIADTIDSLKTNARDP
jgi:hypothetical protein